MNIDLNIDAPASPERTRHLAETLAEITRVLNHATMDHAALGVPGDAERVEYMRLLMDASESTSNMSLGLVLYGYRTRADGSPTHVRPVARSLDADQVEIVVTPGEEARRALHGGTLREGLSPAAQVEYDRLLALVMASMTSDSAADPGPEA